MNQSKTRANEELVQYGFSKNPRRESLLDLVRTQIVPFWRLWSVTTLVACADVCCFLVALLADGERTPRGGFLAPSQPALYWAGEVYPSAMKSEPRRQVSKEPSCTVIA